MYNRIEESNQCSYCGRSLSYVGMKNGEHLLECIECGTRYTVRESYSVDRANHAVFDGYSEPVKYCM